MKRFKYIMLSGILLLSFVCNSKDKQKVPLEQLNIDNSNDYKYIFKDIIEEERRKEEQKKKDAFMD